MEKLRRDPNPDRMARAVEEILRWASPILYFRRTATRDVELRGKTIESGESVVLWYVSGTTSAASTPAVMSPGPDEAAPGCAEMATVAPRRSHEP
jgi:hypothetical protein